MFPSLEFVGAVGGIGGAAADHPIGRVALALGLILIVAKLAGDLAVRLGQPAVLGELLAGIGLGNLVLLGWDGLAFLRHDEYLGLLAEVGVILLLFEIGLESTVREMAKVGVSAFLVAVLGVVTPFALGWGVGAVLLPEHSVYVHAFLGATLTATSVGITARVLRDLGRSQSQEARVILGAAVIDDVLGLVILAVVAAVVVEADRGGSLSYGALGGILAKALGFLTLALALGTWLSPRLFALASRLRGEGILLSLALAFCFLLAWLAQAIALAPIVGAYAAGLVLEKLHFHDFVTRGERELEELVNPIASFLVPVFFVVMGARVQLESFGEPGVLGLAAALTAAAFLGKQACSIGVLGRGMDRLSVGIGMVPRGEVGLIFANIGLGLAVGGEAMITASTYSAVVIMVVVTTLVTPPALAWSLRRHGRAGPALTG